MRWEEERRREAFDALCISSIVSLCRILAAVLLPLRTCAPSSSACLKVIQNVEEYSFSFGSPERGRTLWMPASDNARATELHNSIVRRFMG
jgi:hypothetical protein